ncbi:hypothetical protein H0H93_013100, partial [Arthromyces matolae]
RAYFVRTFYVWDSRLLSNLDDKNRACPGFVLVILQNVFPTHSNSREFARKDVKVDYRVFMERDHAPTGETFTDAWCIRMGETYRVVILCASILPKPLPPTQIQNSVMDSTKKEQRDEDISPEELKRRMLNLQRSPKKRAAWLRYLYSKKKWRVEYLVGFLLATKETVEREIALISQAADIVPTTDDLCDEKKVILSSPMQGTAAIEDGKYLPPPEWFKQAASKFKERVREISRQRKLKEAQKTEENDLQMKQPASPVGTL